MPRLLGVDIPNDKMAWISLTYLYGVGPHVSRELCHKAGVNPHKKARELAEDELGRLICLAGTRLCGGGTAATPNGPKHLAATRYWLLPGLATSSWITGPRATHEDQRSYPQGAQENRGWQEGCERSQVIRESHKFGGGIVLAARNGLAARCPRTRR